MRATMSDAIKAGVVKPGEMFSPEVQRRIANWRIGMRRQNAESLAKQRGGSVDYWMQHELSKEWASLPDPQNGGRGHYPGQHSSVSGAELNRAMKKKRDAERIRHKVEGAATLDVNFNGMPAGTRTKSTASGLFTSVKLDTGRSMRLASA